MGFSESDSSKCRRHPNHKQLPGVCSSCLREKLSKLNTTPSFNRVSATTNLVTYSSSLSSSPPYSSASSASTATTVTRKSPGNRHRRNGSEAYVSVGMVLNNGLKKSRSVSCAPLSRNRGGGSNNNNNNNMGNEKNIIDGRNENCGVVVEEQDGNGKKKGGFFKKLIHSTSKKTKGALMHSKTMKERSHTATMASQN